MSNPSQLPPGMAHAEPAPAGRIAPPSAPPAGTPEPPLVTYRCPLCAWTLDYRVNDSSVFNVGGPIDRHAATHPTGAPGAAL